MDLIDRKALLERMRENASFATSYKPYMTKEEIAFRVLKDAKEQALRFVEDAPTIESVPVVHGNNMTEMNPVDEFICSECGCIFKDVSRYEYDEECDDWHCYEFEFRFCPYCGAKIKAV